MSWPQRKCFVDWIEFESLTKAAAYIGVSPNYMAACASKKYCRTVKGHKVFFGPRVYEELRTDRDILRRTS